MYDTMMGFTSDDTHIFDGPLERLTYTLGEASAIAGEFARRHCWLRPALGGEA